MASSARAPTVLSNERRGLRPGLTRDAASGRRSRTSPLYRSVRGADAFYAPPGMDQGGIQLATVSLPDSPGRTAPPATGMAVPAEPGLAASGPVYTQEPTQDFGMAYGPGPQMPPGYPMPAAGATPYGAFPMPEPVAPRWYVRGEVVWLFRDSPNDRNLTSYNNASKSTDPLNNRFILDTDALPFGVAPACG